VKPDNIGAALLRIRRDGGLIFFERTPTGQFFYDLVFGRQTAKRLAKKWNLTRREITKLRRLGRKGLRSNRPIARSR
jgi:hypothetical protein